MKTNRIAATAAALAFLASPALAADTWKIDTSHVYVGFEVNHLGFSTTYGRFNDVSGTIAFDEENPEKSAVEVKIDPASVDTGHKERDEHIRGKDFFNVEAFPEMSFKSTSIELTGEETGTITGDLTMHGVTKPVTLDARLTMKGDHPMQKGLTAMGFNATASLKRSDYGIEAYVPMIGDELPITISFEAHKQ
ncbi:MAG: YceI family protein [Parvibaculum sp.]|uniref:YceI family protein n=1 Tax=Parvibaculum sp. TaxID=2024848 RepID=UPI002AB8FD7E|nr:YceI family protein [Parvibaculum sp.]MDZ4379785.1 YceI family protein [Parvibaculum sp.]